MNVQEIYNGRGGTAICARTDRSVNSSYSRGNVIWFSLWIAERNSKCSDLNKGIVARLA